MKPGCKVVNNGVEVKEAAMRGIRAFTVENLARLTGQAVARLQANGCRVLVAGSIGEALDFVAQVGGTRGSGSGKRRAVLSRVPAGEEIGLAAFLAGQGVSVWHAHAGEWLLRALGLAGGHPYRPTLGLAQLNDVLVKVAGLNGLPPRPPDAFMAALAGKTTQACLEADLGVTGAQAIAVETGTIFLAEDEGDARLVSNLPHTHLVVAGVECLVRDLGDALATVRYLSRYAFGRPLVRYVSAISGPSRTGDIEMRLVPGMHGPKEVAVLLLDRLPVPPGHRAALQCLHCGACLPAPVPVPGESWPYPGTAGAVLRRLYPTGRGTVAAADSFTLCPLGIDMPGLWAVMTG